LKDRKPSCPVPEEFLLNHISGSFVEMVQWWVRRNMKETPEELDAYFRAVIRPLL
ncbi:MAG TPA: TetR family transcriptional regulator, partial [Dialister sp.]|nr:TetR family transcriptional regulator [Dialister sp.]